MFRPMRRANQQLDMTACQAILTQETRGVLSVLGDNGYPYGMPMNHWYCKEDGVLYFHGAGVGHKLDAICKCEKASYCVYDKGYRAEGDWAWNVQSVIVFGRMSLVTDATLAQKICQNLGQKFTNDTAYLERLMEKHFSKVQCLALTPEHMTGKLVKEK